MKKRVYGKKLSRGRGARKALFRSLIKALITNGSIKTTRAKAKSVQGDIDRLVNLAKDGNVASVRRVYATLGNDRKTSDRLVSKVAKTLNGQNSGYTRTIPLPQRKGDLAEMVRLEWVKKVEDKISEKAEAIESKSEKESLKDKLQKKVSTTSKTKGEGKKNSKSKEKKKEEKSKKSKTKK